MFHEYGFRVDEVDDKEQNSNKLLGNAFVEDPQHRIQWVEHLEFSNDKVACDLIWDKAEVRLPRTETLRSMARAGIPHSLRPQMWMRLSGALQKKFSSEISYKDIVKASSNDELTTSKQIEKDLLRTMPGNVHFRHMDSTGIPPLRRLLRGMAWLHPDIGYCQGTGMIASYLLLFMEEEDAFWILSTTVEDILPASYYSPTLLGIQVDQRVLTTMICNYLPRMDAKLKQHDVELSLVTLNWFLTLFASAVNMKILLRIWDLLFCDGSIVLFQVILGMLKLKEPDIEQLKNSAEICKALSDMPGAIEDADHLLDVSFKVAASFNYTVIETHRRKHLVDLMADQAALVGNPKAVPSLPKQHHSGRQIKKSKSVLQPLLSGGKTNEGDTKSKYHHQAEILVDLREAILQVAHHFMSVDPKLSKVALVPDYTMESHSHDHGYYASVSRTHKRRAKALLDFKPHDDDELDFQENDIITIISQEDEHCWVGELNGLRGWFPAKFVELLDERSKQYSCAGDDSVSKAVTYLVRGILCPVVRQVLEYGMKGSTFLRGPCHPWLFIEEAATKEVERDFNSVYSRLLLCKAYRLDEDGKVLTPKELLYRCVQAINLSHDKAHAQMDVKLRSLVCVGLNEQVLHLWLEVLCSSAEVVQKWYQPWSIVCSQGWVQIKCELRVLSQFAFNLNPDWELKTRKKQSQSLKEEVRDMLMKHHLFSWDL
jgi:hypothetical protein